MSMKKETIKELFLKGEVDCDITIRGWIRSVRKSKHFSFLVLNDGTTINNLQVIVDATLSDYEKISTFLTGTSIEVFGKLVKSQGKGQSLEVQAKSVNVLGLAPENYPLQKKATSLEFLREVAHLRPRTQLFGAIFRLRHALAMATHSFFDKEGFYYLHSPIISGSDCEGAGEMFLVTTLDVNNLPMVDGKPDHSKDYFGKETHLTVSGQLQGECFAMGLNKVYTFGPTFRAENSNTPRHLAEFWMIEPEMAFYDLDDNANLAASYIKYLISYALEKCPEEMEYFSKRLEEENKDAGHIERLKLVRDSEFKRITYTEAVEILSKSNKKFEFPTHWGAELQTEHERYLTEVHFKAPVIVTDYPKGFKAFYMKLNDDQKTVRAMDVLVPGVGEIIGGSQREEDFEKLSKRIKELGMKEEDYSWYLDLRRFGSVPHSGFGLGFERAMMYISGMSNIRDVIPFPRTPKNAEF